MSSPTIHHFSAGTMCPLGVGLFPGLFPREVVCHCLLVELEDRLVLVDTGLGVDDIRNPERLGPIGRLLRPELDVERTAHRRVQQLGFSPGEVTDIVVTHLDFDHAGGIEDFESARIHVLGREYEAARRRGDLQARLRYRRAHLVGSREWRTFELGDGERWKGFDCARRIDGLPPEVLAVRLPGHSAGHVGIAVQREEGWLLHAGDAYYDRRELAADATSPRGIKWFEWFADDAPDAARRTRERLRPVSRHEDVDVVCAHDPAGLPRP